MKQLVLHPTDLSSDTYSAFAHALRISLNDKSGIYILHAGKDQDKNISWENYPAVRATLQKWGEISADAKTSDVHKILGIDVEKVEARAKNIVDSILRFCKTKRNGIDLIVVGTQGRKGLPRWLKPSTSEKIARNANIPTLFVPQKSNGFVNPETGKVSIENVLVAVDHSPPAQIGATATAEFMRNFKKQNPHITFLHIGEKHNRPNLDFHSFSNFQHDYQVKSGSAVEEILTTAKDINANLIVMTSHGHDGFLDVLRGSITERVLKGTPCPLLMIPAS